MKKHILLRAFAMALVFSLVVISRHSPAGSSQGPGANAAAIRVNAGNNFALIPTANPAVFGHEVDGVAQVSSIGNCHFHGDGTVLFPTGPNEPIRIVSGSPWTLTSSDGANSLKFDVEGTAAFDPANAAFGNIVYKATFVGGTGAFAGATGTGTMEVTAEFNSLLTGLATWTMKGTVITPPGKVGP